MEDYTEDYILSAAGRRLKPRQVDFIKHYLSPSSDTYSHAANSAIKAGYAKGYALCHAYRKLKPLAEKVMNARERSLSENVIKYDRMLEDAEKAIQSDLQIPDDSPPSMRAIRAKQSAFVAERIGKDKYSTRSEQVNTHHVVLDDNKRNMLQATLATLIDGETIENPTYQVLTDGNAHGAVPDDDSETPS